MPLSSSNKILISSIWSLPPVRARVFTKQYFYRQQTIFHGGPVRQQIRRDEIEQQTETGSTVLEFLNNLWGLGTD
jgi:hypothetical protein